MSTHNICFRQEIRKILCGYPILSIAMTGGHLKITSCCFVFLFAMKT